MLDRRRCAVALEPSSPVRDPRRRVLDAFVQTVAREGYDRTTIEAVLVLAEIPEPVFYEHFEDKQDCMLAALDEQIRWIEDAISERVDGSAGWSERVRLGLQALLEALAGDPEGARAGARRVPRRGRAGPRAPALRRGQLRAGVRAGTRRARGRRRRSSASADIRSRRRRDRLDPPPSGARTPYRRAARPASRSPVLRPHALPRPRARARYFPP